MIGYRPVIVYSIALYNCILPFLSVVLYCMAACLVTGAANDRGEHSPGGIVSGEASLHKAGAVVAHKGGSLLVVTHDCF